MSQDTHCYYCKKKITEAFYVEADGREILPMCEECYQGQPHGWGLALTFGILIMIAGLAILTGAIYLIEYMFNL